MPLVITRKDIRRAEQFLVSLLEAETDLTLDLTPGTASHEILVSGFAAMFAYLKDTADSVAARQSLRRLARLPDSNERTEAIDDLLSNLFLSRKDGAPSRGQVILFYANKPNEVVVSPTARFTRGGDLEFRPDHSSVQVISGQNAIPIRNSAGELEGYEFRVNTISLEHGLEYNIAPGRLQVISGVSPFPVRAYNQDSFAGARNDETTEEILDRAKDALTVRDLVSSRALRTVLRDNFSSVLEVVSIGFGDPEMRRDRVHDSIAPLNFHAGGHIDVYLQGTPKRKQTFEGMLGRSYFDPRPQTTILRKFGAFTSVEPGMILTIENPGEGEASRYVIQEAFPDFVRVSARSPFPRKTDVDAVEFSITAAAINNQTGTFTDEMTKPNTVGLPAVPITYIHSIEYTVGFDWVEIPHRKNSPEGLADDEYCIRVANPVEAPSAYQLMELVTNSTHNNKTVRVTYDTIQDFTAVHNFLINPNHRNLCANTLAKGLHPVVIKPFFTYSVKLFAEGLPSETGMATAIVDHVSSLSAGETLTVSDLIHTVLESDKRIDSVVPWAIEELMSGVNGNISDSDTFSTEDAGIVFTDSNVGDHLVFTSVGVSVTRTIRSVVNDTTVRLLTPTPLDTASDTNWRLERRTKYGVHFDLQAPDGRVIPYRSTHTIRVRKENLRFPSDPLMSLDTENSRSSINLGISFRTLLYLTSPAHIQFERTSD